jgi:2-keto-4-pentenoate hydratase/2-oxohepta-3-ene-1,7-dioic acid hydratase in catechol pathway
MKLATYRVSGGAPRIGLVHDGDRRLFDLKAAAARAGTDAAPFGSMLALIDADEAGLEAARGLFDRRGNEHDLVMEVADVELLAPLPEPRQMRDGMTFPLHIRQGPRGMRRIAAAGNAEALAAIEAEPLPDLAEVYRKVPIYYITNRLIVRGSGATIRWPRYSKVMDYELEFGVVTRRQGVNITAEKAPRSHLRLHDLQRFLGPRSADDRDAGLARAGQGQELRRRQRARPLDRYAGRDRRSLQAQDAGARERRGVVGGRVGGDAVLVRGDDRLHVPRRDPARGRVHRLGHGRQRLRLEHGRFLQHGDTIELEVERLGILKNRVERQELSA